MEVGIVIQNKKDEKLKIFAYVGSYRANSRTVKVTNDIVNELTKLINIDIDYKIFTPGEQPLENCKGCNRCFYTGECNIDDCILNYKEQLCEADIIILGSPVYLHQVSGNMKNFIDRIAEWIHIFKLIGKLGIVISTSSNNGNSPVTDYLESVLEYLGTSIIGTFSFESIDFEDELVYFSIIRHYANLLYNQLRSKEYKISERQEQYFKGMKKIMLYQNENLFEKQYWLQNDLFKYEEFCQLFDEKCRLKYLYEL